MATPVEYPSNKLTVVFRDDGPMIHANDGPTYRSVQITLTDEQVRALALHWTHTIGKTVYFEQISKCFIEPAMPKSQEPAHA